MVSRIKGVLAGGLGVGHSCPGKRMWEQSWEDMLVERESTQGRGIAFSGLRFHPLFCKTGHLHPDASDWK